MDFYDTLSLSLLIGIIGTVIAVYQAAIIRENKSRYKELQYLLAGISNMALGKQQTWVNQGYWLPEPKSELEIQIIRLHARARDDFAEISNSISALEGTIDSEHSAITEMLKKSIEQIKLNNELQAEGLKNPTLSANQKLKSSNSNHH